MYSWLDLDPDEEVLHATNPSYWRTVPAILVGLIGVVAGIAVMFHPQASTLLKGNNLPVGVGIVLLSLVMPVFREVRRRSEVYIVTDQQIVHKQGILATNTDPIPHAGIADYRIRRNPIDRALGKGDIEMSTAGSDGDDVYFRDIPHCKRVKGTLSQHVKRNRNQNPASAF